MRTVIITHHADRHYYFTNRILASLGNDVVGVFTGTKLAPSKKPDLSTPRGRHIWYCERRNQILNIFFRKYRHQMTAERKHEEGNAFQGSKDTFESQSSHLRIAHVSDPTLSINHPDHVEKIRALKPDVIAVMGSCMLKEDVIRSAPLVLNMHTGLSPYYRGSCTNLFPILESDYGHFGITVHVMSLGIDSGDIVFTQTPPIFQDDNYYRVNSRCIRMGVELMIKALQLADNGPVQAVKQWTKGKLFFNRDLNGFVARRYYQVREPFFRKHVELEQQGQLPTLRIISPEPALAS